ncbi:MAG: amino acid ABC transporter ATP-binding protein [Clostridia bacterium]|nr:amino acid ABC transporter ATP-binding protein [Clostridia bacterium]MBR2448988.1 amino acid ABC transporter ATP-binding protein [Clostridia bacterium]
MAYLSIENFYKSFGKTEVLKGINLSMQKGEVVSIIGSSGSGKTTLLRCINFLETPDNGVMTLDGELLFNSNAEKKDGDMALRNKRLNFGLVFQSFNLFPQYNVFKNITLAPTLLLKDKIKAYKKQLQEEKLSRKEISSKIATFKEAEKKAIDKDAEELLEKIGLTEKRNSFPCELSGGQCQRVAIARALALKPKILCFDEPTSALDPELTGEVLKVIRALKDEDRTMIIVTHEMGFAKNVSDKIVFMADGVIEEEGAPKDVIENPKSEKLKTFLHGVTNKDGE